MIDGLEYLAEDFGEWVPAPATTEPCWCCGQAVAPTPTIYSVEYNCLSCEVSWRQAKRKGPE